MLESAIRERVDLHSRFPLEGEFRIITDTTEFMSIILSKTRHDLCFMQGFDVPDTAGNVVGIIDRIQGDRFLDCVHNMDMGYETYTFQYLPHVLNNIVRCVETIERLHKMNKVHGDIRNDHILIDRKTGTYTWIDFDYTYEWAENPYGVDLYGLGNILLLTVGKEFHNLPDLGVCCPRAWKVASCLTAADMSLFFKHRIMNLQKLFPYIPDSLNHVLLHFSQGTPVFYETVEEILGDLRECALCTVH
jgi:hypothetical protein